jgi:hypothetical protein
MCTCGGSLIRAISCLVIRIDGSVGGCAIGRKSGDDIGPFPSEGLADPDRGWQHPAFDVLVNRTSRNLQSVGKGLARHEIGRTGALSH